jgi:hypothetical protein
MGVGPSATKHTLDYTTKKTVSVAGAARQKVCRVTVNLTDRSKEALDEVVARTADSKTDTINRALQIYAFLERIRANGDQLLIKSSDGNIQLIKFV